jgi:hypothetical protein
MAYTPYRWMAHPMKIRRSKMRTYILTLAFATLSIGAIGQDRTQLDFVYFGDVKGAVSRLLSLPGYTTRSIGGNIPVHPRQAPT